MRSLISVSFFKKIQIEITNLNEKQKNLHDGDHHEDHHHDDSDGDHSNFDNDDICS